MDDDASMTYTVTFKAGCYHSKILLHSRSTAIKCKCRGSWVVGRCHGSWVLVWVWVWVWVNQGHPATVFCRISVQRSKYCL